MTMAVSTSGIPAGVVRAAVEGQWLGVDWGAFLVVLVVTLLAGLATVIFYSLGLRLLAVGAPDDELDETARDGVITAPRLSARPALATVGAVLCFAVSGGAVLYGLYLLIPFFH
ncbi:hypothetical protein WDJ51_11595 [Rathayibacter sp. YIM 133350]|uniref:hypothetical protein n=1 Tax=Rathayibacter sp. YIM 133350 TaxID=3131992 RepID=UPI00307F8AD7